MINRFYENEINREGIEYIDHLLHAYQNGRVSLPNLASKLDIARGGLLFPDEEWLTLYTKIWGVIEECNAFALDEGQTDVVDRYEDILNNAVIEMRSFLKETFLLST